MSQTGWTDKRPMSPFVSVWRWHVTMLVSILHRATGCALYAGAIIVAGWLFAIVSGPDYYAGFEMLLGSIPGQILLFLFVLSFLFHALNGIRHLVWDAGKGFDPKVASFTAWGVIGLSVVLAGMVWWAAGLFPGLPGLVDGAYP